LHRR